MVSWSALAPSTSTTRNWLSHRRCARSLTASNVSVPAISRSRLCFAWSTLISEVAIRIVTGPPANRRYPVTFGPPPPGSIEPATTGLSNVAYTNSRVAPADSPLRTSEKPVTIPFAVSRVRPPALLTLSKMRLASAPGNVNRISAAWSVGAISDFSPLSNVTP